MTQSPPCTVAHAAKERECCPRSVACAFWQPGARDLESGCAAQRLGLDQMGPDVAEFLLPLRAIAPARTRSLAA
jgi:hypothetical protein